MNNSSKKFIKDKKIQIYFAHPTQTPGEYIKRYIYSKKVYDSGGLWAYVRDLSTNETISSGVLDLNLTAQFVVNYNPKILKYVAEGLCISWRSPLSASEFTYSVRGEPDSFEYGINDIKLRAERTTETRIFVSEGFESD